jgi:hypothetical protein
VAPLVGEHRELAEKAPGPRVATSMPFLVTRTEPEAMR